MKIIMMMNKIPMDIQTVPVNGKMKMFLTVGNDGSLKTRPTLRKKLIN